MKDMKNNYNGICSQRFKDRIIKLRAFSSLHRCWNSFTLDHEARYYFCRSIWLRHSLCPIPDDPCFNKVAIRKFQVNNKIDDSFLWIFGSNVTIFWSIQTVDDLPGALPPVGFFDPLGFAEKADENTLKRYREAEITHGRVAMLATVGFLVGEKVEGSSFLFDSQISGPAITHLSQVPAPFWTLLAVAIAKLELDRAQYGWVSPRDVPVDQPGLLRADYIPGDFGFDPLGLKPEDPEALESIQTKELQNGRLAMLAAAGFMAQELANGKGILENLGL